MMKARRAAKEIGLSEEKMSPAEKYKYKRSKWVSRTKSPAMVKVRLELWYSLQKCSGQSEVGTCGVHNSGAQIGLSLLSKPHTVQPWRSSKSILISSRQQGFRKHLSAANMVLHVIKVV